MFLLHKTQVKSFVSYKINPFNNNIIIQYNHYLGIYDLKLNKTNEIEMHKEIVDFFINDSLNVLFSDEIRIFSKDFLLVKVIKEINKCKLITDIHYRLVSNLNNKEQRLDKDNKVVNGENSYIIKNSQKYENYIKLFVIEDVFYIIYKEKMKIIYKDLKVERKIILRDFCVYKKALFLLTFDEIFIQSKLKIKQLEIKIEIKEIERFLLLKEDLFLIMKDKKIYNYNNDFITNNYNDFITNFNNNEFSNNDLLLSSDEGIYFLEKNKIKKIISFYRINKIENNLIKSDKSCFKISKNIIEINNKNDIIKNSHLAFINYDKSNNSNIKLENDLLKIYRYGKLKFIQCFNKKLDDFFLIESILYVKIESKFFLYFLEEFSLSFCFKEIRNIYKYELVKIFHEEVNSHNNDSINNENINNNIISSIDSITNIISDISCIKIENNSVFVSSKNYLY